MGSKDYAFQVSMFAVIHVDAKSEEEAKGLLEKYGDSFSVEQDVGAGNILRLTEVSIDGEPDLIMVDGEDVPVEEPGPVENLAMSQTPVLTSSEAEDRLTERLDRLRRLEALNAPEIILHNERCLLAQALGLLFNVSNPNKYSLPEYAVREVMPASWSEDSRTQALVTGLQYLEAADFSGDPDWPAVLTDAQKALESLNEENRRLRIALENCKTPDNSNCYKSGTTSEIIRRIWATNEIIKIALGEK